jgi:CPA2 family monovalent cation:H+ antiporter-2
MMLDVGFVLGSIDRLALAVALLVVGKGTVVLLVALASRNSLDVALRTSAQLAQAGEFGLVLMQLAFEQKLVGTGVFQVTVSAMLISMFLAPFLIERVSRMTGLMSRGDWAHKAKVIHDIAVGGFGLDRHVIVCGFGRTGQQIGEFLDGEDLPFIALDVDPRQVRRAPTRKGKVFFGNPDRPEVLKAAGLARARALVIAFPDVTSAERVLRLVRQSRPEMPVIVRAPDDTAVAALKKAGATEVIPEVLEAGLVVAAETLTQLGVPLERTMAQVRAIRAERYPSLRVFYRESVGSRTEKTETLR